MSYEEILYATKGPVGYIKAAEEARAKDMYYSDLFWCHSDTFNQLSTKQFML